MNRGPIIGIIIAIIIVLAGGIGGCVACVKLNKIPPGFVGVSVRKCGEAGVKKDPIPTGYYWRELFCEDVEKYPISMQSLVLTKNAHEGKGGPDGQEYDQSLSVTSSEGLGIEVDIAFNFTLDPKLVPMIYEKWRADIDHIEHQYLRQTIREAVQNTFAKYTAEELYASKKETARAEVEKFLSDHLTPLGFVPSQFTINRIQPPPAVIEAINAKVAMSQRAQQSQQEVAKKEAEARQAVAVAEGEAKAAKARAEGEASAITLRADAQARANKILAESLTSALIDYQRTLRWDGKMPQVTSGVVPMFQVHP